MRDGNTEYDGRVINTGCLAIVAFAIAIDVAALLVIVELVKWIVTVVTGG